jgi:predicted NBD/HSP70 family sugar kinase
MRILMDIGATRIRTTTPASTSRAPLQIKSTPRTYEALLETIFQEISSFVSHSNDVVSGLFVACPGQVNFDGSVELALYAPVSGANLRGDLEARFGFPVTVVNDAKAQALGCVADEESLVYFSLGTAVGGAIVDHGRLVLGAHGYAGEVGHLPVQDTDLLCPCGRRGCLDTIASGWSLETALGRDWWRNPTPQARIRVGISGSAVGYIARLLAWLTDPTRVVVAGWLSSYAEFQHAVRERFSYEPHERATLEFAGDTWQFARKGLERLASGQAPSLYLP